MPIQIDETTPWYRTYRYKLWYKFILDGRLNTEHINWLTENVGPNGKKWMYDTRMDTESFKVVMDMLHNMDGDKMFGGRAQDLCFPTRLYFKHDDDKLHFVLRWL